MAEAGAVALIGFLKNSGQPAHIPTDNITVGAWLEKFTAIEGNPRPARNVAKNRPYSPQSVDRLKGLYENHKLIKFLLMAFKEYGRSHQKWHNAFRDIEPPKSTRMVYRDALTEDEVVSLFGPGILQDVMDLAVCGVMFLSGLRRGEIFVLKPEDLDWRTPEILVRRAWQDFDRRSRVIGPTKGKKERVAPFDQILQEAIKRLWEENGEHEYVFAFKNGKTPGPSWTKGRLRKITAISEPEQPIENCTQAI
jgi:integrase